MNNYSENRGFDNYDSHYRMNSGSLNERELSKSFDMNSNGSNSFRVGSYDNSRNEFFENRMNKGRMNNGSDYDSRDKNTFNN